MGSKRKKAEKKKDFVKQKLKVGKTKAKPNNSTDTSFVAKTIRLSNQSISKRTTTHGENHEEADLLHHLSLTKHHSSSTRKEVLIYIEQHLPSNPSLYKQLLQAIIPLILDESTSVRETLISLLTASAKQQPGLMDLHCKSIILFVHSAMSHIAPNIRNSSTKFLNVLSEYAGNSLARGYFIKTLKAFFQILAWTLKDDKRSISLAITSTASGGASKKARITHLQSLRKFLAASVLIQESENELEQQPTTGHPLGSKYLLPTIPETYSSLQLFSKELASSKKEGKSSADEGKLSLDDLDGISTEDIDTRKRVLIEVFSKPMRNSLKSLIKEGGEVGREANSVLALLNEVEGKQTIKEEDEEQDEEQD